MFQNVVASGISSSKFKPTENYATADSSLWWQPSTTHLILMVLQDSVCKK